MALVAFLHVNREIHFVIESVHPKLFQLPALESCATADRGELLPGGGQTGQVNPSGQTRCHFPMIGHGLELALMNFRSLTSRLATTQDEATHGHTQC